LDITKVKKVGMSLEEHRDGYDIIVKENELFEWYYRSLGLMKDDRDFEAFMTYLRTPLPTTFRITGSKR
jgi:hypothetical protein